MSQVAFVCACEHVMSLEAMSFIFLLYPPATSAAGEKEKWTVALKDSCNLETQAKNTKPLVEIILFSWTAVSYFLFCCLFVLPRVGIALLNPGS